MATVNEVERKLTISFDVSIFGTQDQVETSRAYYQKRLRALCHEPNLEVRVTEHDHEAPGQLTLMETADPE